MTGEQKDALPVPPPGKPDEKDWEERRRVALEAWKLGQKLASAQGRVTAGARRIHRRGRARAK